LHNKSAELELQDSERRLKPCAYGSEDTTYRKSPSIDGLLGDACFADGARHTAKPSGDGAEPSLHHREQ